MINKLTLKDLEEIVGEVPKEGQELLDKYDFRYEKLSKEENEKIMLNAFKIINSDKLTIAGNHRRPDWERGWSENLEDFKKECNMESLIPKYYNKSNNPIRLFGEYVIPLDKRFEFNLCSIIKLFAFKKYFNDVDSIYEFGCGSGYNLPILAELYPQKEIGGLDWVESSKKSIEEINKNFNLDIKGHVFDMFHPDENFNLKGKSAVITVGSLEQLGENYHNFLDYLLKQKPEICINMEPLKELYEDNLFDYVAKKFHEKRGYLGNYLASLHQLESKNKIEISKIHRVPCGSMMFEAYSSVVWGAK